MPLSEAIQFFPTYGYQDLQNGNWRLRVAGRVIKPRADSMRRKIILRVIRQLLKATDEQLTSTTFQDRVSGFLMMGMRGRRIRVELDGMQFRFEKRTNGGGEFRSAISLTESEREALAVGNESVPLPWIDFRSRATKKIPSAHHGRMQLIDGAGCSVISDIDDTIKTSNVLDRAELLAHTFFEPFHAVPGMADLFGRWKQAGVAFHYVSSSPWQLYPPLATFLNASSFPDGSFHLRSIRLRDPSILQLLVGRKRSKKQAIRQILRDFPGRRFVLIGDIGEKDPEIYGAAARKFPDQIEHICLRRLHGGRVNPERFARAFRKVPVQKWRLFDEAKELESLVPLDRLGWSGGLL